MSDQITQSLREIEEAEQPQPIRTAASERKSTPKTLAGYEVITDDFGSAVVVLQLCAM